MLNCFIAQISSLCDLKEILENSNTVGKKNLLDDENGRIYDAGYLGVTKSLDVTVNADNTYTYSNFDDGHLRYRNGSRFVSAWKAMVGFKLSF